MMNQVKKNNQTISYREGFTLIESMVGMAILVILFAALVVFFQGITDMVGEAKLRVAAIALASDRLEVIRNMKYDDLGTVGGIPNGPLLQEETVEVNGIVFEVETDIYYVDDPFDGLSPTDAISTDYKRARVAVGWSGVFAAKTPVVLTSDIASNGIEGQASGGTLVVRVINASGNPVSGADVKVKNTQVVPEIDLELVSDAGGNVFLPGAPECTGECYQIQAGKNNYSTERTYSRTEVANPLTPHASVFDGDVTVVTLSIDAVSSLAVYVTGSKAFNYPPFPGVLFNLRGNKIIGTNGMDQPVYKFSQNFVSGIGGYVLIQNLEWDTYEIIIPSGSTVDFAGSLPLTPFPLVPGLNGTVRFATAGNSENSLLVKVRNIGGTPVATASVTLINNEVVIASGSAGAAGRPDEGQVIFPNLAAEYFGVKVRQVGYADASSAAMVTGDVVEVVLLQGE